MREFTDPVLLEAMPLADKLLYSAMTMVLGLGITFLVLIVLMATIKIMSAALSGKREKAEPVAQPVAPAPVAAPSVVETNEETDDQELIAVITAAIMSLHAEHGEQKRFKINAIRKAGEGVPSWAAAGIHDAMRN